MLISSLYVVIAYEASIGDIGPAAILYMVPAALVIFFGKPNMVKLFACVDSIEMHRADSAIAMVQREHTLRRGLRAIKLLYQLSSFIERRAHASGGAVNEAHETLQVSPLPLRALRALRALRSSEK